MTQHSLKHHSDAEEREHSILALGIFVVLFFGLLGQSVPLSLHPVLVVLVKANKGVGLLNSAHVATFLKQSHGSLGIILLISGSG